MELRDAIIGRRSVRAFTDDPLPAGTVERLKEACLWAPSAGNLQARHFLFVTNPDLRAALGASSYQSKLFAAPLVVAGCADHRIESKYRDRGKELYAPQDVAAAVQNLLLTAHDLGLGAVWVGAFREEQAASALDLPAHLRPVVLVPVGVPAETPSAPPRVPPEKAFTHLD